MVGSLLKGLKQQRFIFEVLFKDDVECIQILENIVSVTTLPITDVK